ncbi:putative potassium transporter 3 [Drosera capensis]
MSNKRTSKASASRIELADKDQHRIHQCVADLSADKIIAGTGANEISQYSMQTKVSFANLPRNLLLAYQSIGVVYGDLSTSPSMSLRALSRESCKIIKMLTRYWMLTLIPLLKYAIIVLSADGNGEGELQVELLLFTLSFGGMQGLVYYNLSTPAQGEEAAEKGQQSHRLDRGYL